MLSKKDLAKLKKTMTKEECTVSKIIGYYVTEDEKGKKSVSSEFNKNFLNLDENEFYKYLEIIKQILSGKVGDSLIQTDVTDNNIKSALLSMSSGALNQVGIIESFRDSIIDNYAKVGNYLILFFADSYDIPDIGDDGRKTGEYSGVYQYILCAICPVSLSEPGLGCSKENKEIGVLERDWMVNKAESGFIYPVLDENSENKDSIAVYYKNPKDKHFELAEKILNCETGLSASEKRMMITETLSEVISEAIEADLNIDKRGNIVGFKERLEDIKKRYGEQSKEYLVSKANSSYIKTHKKELKGD